ncbi:type VI secretion system membrane subunit TssM [Utexia brackfieldae]|uniref:type VI secretion system membrane subunit TssM n=1 Tax=Utexia brackfieldae TaxID=3074108 RepID=UPI00370D08B9
MKLPKPRLPKFKFKSTISTIIIVVWCLALLWMWLFGPSFIFLGQQPFASLLTRWLITLFSAICMMIWVIYRLYKRVKWLNSQQQLTKQTIKDPVQIAVNDQQRYLTRWRLRLKQHIMRKDFNYALPWYLVIGDVNSGKTTFLKEGEKLNTLYEPAQPQAVQCWLTDQAVIIETAGRLFEQNSDTAHSSLPERLWKNVLQWLVTERTRQPLNGIVLTIDIFQFSTMSKYEKDRYMARLKARLAEIASTLHCQLPVYIILTKLDLLYGFEAMFQTLDKSQREEIVGVTFSDPQKDWRSALNEFWQQWLNQLNHALPTMMINSVDVSQRSQLFTFIREVNGIKVYIDQMIDHCFFSLKAQPFLVRGVYLTSSTQKGQMEDLFVKSAASQYHLPEQIYPSWQKPVSYSYFTHNLCQSLLFKETQLASENQVYQRYQQRQFFCWGTLTAIIGIAILAGWQYCYRDNYRAGEAALLKAQQYMHIDLPEQKDYYGDLQLPLLNPIGDATIAYGDYHRRNRLFADMGLYQGYKIGPYIDHTYLKLLQQRFLPAIMNGLQADLAKAQPGSEEKLTILRIMRMIEDESGRDNAMVIQYMASRWSTAFKGQSERQDQLLRHLVYALEHIQWKQARTAKVALAIDSFLPFQQSIQDAQVDLRRLSIYQRVYQNLLSKSKIALPVTLNIRNQIGAGFDEVFVSDNPDMLDIPQLLTREGLVNYFIRQDSQLIQLTTLDSWVLNLTQNTDYSEADRKEIERQITALYLNDYIATWRAAYSNVHIKPFAHITEAINALTQVISGDQIFRRAMVLLEENVSPKALATTEISANLSQQRDYQLLNTLNHAFRQETSVILENNDQTSTLQNIISKLGDMHRYLLAIQHSPDPAKAALQAVQFRLNNSASDPIFETQQMAKTIPEPLGRWIDELTNQVWHVIMVEAIKSLEIQWNEQVVSPYQRYFADRYPFNPVATSDVPLSEFERFFGYGGTLDLFYQQHLKAFVENRLSIDKSGHALIREDVIKQLALADKIRRAYFTQQGLGIQFSLQPIDMSGNRRRGVLNLDGQLVEYKHASNNVVHLIWPNSMRDNIESRLSLIGGNERTDKSMIYTGPWGLIRLFNAGKLTNITSNTFDIRYDIDKAYITYRIHVDESDNPFAGGLFSQFTLPQTLY